MDKQPEEKERTKKKAPSQLGRDRARLLKYRTERKTKNENYNITYGKSDNSTQTKNNTEKNIHKRTHNQIQEFDFLIGNGSPKLNTQET
jgi:hypothetical protein